MLNDLILKIQNLSRRQRMTLISGLMALLGVLLIILTLYQFFMPNSLVTYTNAQWHYSIKYPYSWKKRENRRTGVAAFVSPKESDLDVFQENVTIVVQNLSAKPMTLKAYSDLATKQVGMVFRQGIKVIESQPTYAANQTAYKFVYEGTDTKNPTLNLKAMYVWFIKDNIAYQFNYTALASKFDKYLPVVEKMLGTFSVQ